MNKYMIRWEREKQYLQNTSEPFEWGNKERGLVFSYASLRAARELARVWSGGQARVVKLVQK